MKLDKWQEEVIKAKGNVCLRSGRQVGKSTAISHKAGEFAVQHPRKTVLVIAAVERQAQLLFEKILGYLMIHYSSLIKKGRDRPTKHKIQLKNGSVIHCVPTGLSGYGIRGFTVNLLIADEAAFIPEEVWTAVTPMLAATKGKIILLSTPHGKEGYFYRCFSDPAFKKFHVSSEDCERIDKDFLDREKQRMTTVQYTQEYLGEFVDELMQYFPTYLIERCMVRPKKSPYPIQRLRADTSFLGVDVAAYGGDETALVSLMREGDRLIMIDLEFADNTSLNSTTKKIIYKDEYFNYKRIYIDDGGIGLGVFENLLENEKTKRKVVAINNARRSIDRDNRQKKILKEDLYANLLRLMEQGRIELLKDDNLFLSLKSIQQEYTGGKHRIYGNYSHITEALIRAAWCVKDKSLKIYIYCS